MVGGVAVGFDRIWAVEAGVFASIGVDKGFEVNDCGPLVSGTERRSKTWLRKSKITPILKEDSEKGIKPVQSWVDKKSFDKVATSSHEFL